MAKKLTFTPTGFESLRAGKLADPETQGLMVEVLSSGKKVFKFSRRLSPSVVVRGTFGGYPAKSIADARTWARTWNAHIEEGRDPRQVEKAEAEEAAAAAITVNDAHDLYMRAVRNNDHKVNRQGSGRALKQRTIDDKMGLYNRNMREPIGTRPIASIVADDLVQIVLKLGQRGKTQANRLGAEMQVFFNWVMSLKARTHGFGLTVNPAANIGELWYAESKRERWLDEIELPIFLKALAHEGRVHQRALLLFLLTGARRSELLFAPTSEYRSDSGMWVIPAFRSKNHEEHPIMLGEWGRSLMQTSDAWIIQSFRRDNEGNISSMAAGWTKILARIRKRMSDATGVTIEHFTLHDLRRTFRSHIDDIVDETVAERMMNHKLRGLVARYNRNKRAAAMAAGFAAWDVTLAAMAREAGVGEALGVPALTKAAEPRPTLQRQHA